MHARTHAHARRDGHAYNAIRGAERMLCFLFCESYFASHRRDRTARLTNVLLDFSFFRVSLALVPCARAPDSDGFMTRVIRKIVDLKFSPRSLASTP